MTDGPTSGGGTPAAVIRRRFALAAALEAAWLAGLVWLAWRG